MKESVELTPVDTSLERGIVRASGDVLAALSEYQTIQANLDGAMKDMIIRVGGKLFRKKQYWRAIATAFNLDVTMTKEEKETGVDDWGYKVTYRATAPNGRVADGDGSCFVSEKYAGQKTVHNVRSHAHTRAFNRAVSNLVGFGEVSAEEMPRGQQPEHDVPDHDETRGVVTHAPDDAPPIPASVKPTEAPKPQAVTSKGITISEKQVKRLWGIAYGEAKVKGLGNQDAQEFVRCLLDEYGYSKTEKIVYENYDPIILRIKEWGKM